MTLFGSAEFLGEEYDKAVDLLQYAEMGELDPQLLYPIAASDNNINIIVIDDSEENGTRPVRWFAGYELERYEDFASFFDHVISMFEFDRDRPIGERPY
jgi:hypothetical protein